MKFLHTIHLPSHHKHQTQQTPHTVSTIKLPILKKGEYNIWAMKMEHYLAHTDYPIWEVIQNGNGLVSITTDTQGQIKVLPPECREICSHEKEKEKRCGMPSNQIGGNDESKKSRKIHGAGVSTEDANQKFLRSLPSAWSQLPSLDHEDLEQLDEYDLEEMDLKWQVTMISMRMKKFYKKTGRKLQFDAKEPVGFDKTKVECYNCHKTGHFARECRTKGNQDSRRRYAWNSGNKDGRRFSKQEDSKALVTTDGEGVDWTSHSKEEEDYALMACNNSGSDTEIDLDDKTDVLTYHKKLLAEAMKEKEDLKAKVEKWHNSSKNLGKLINTQMSATDKFGLGYGDHRYDGILSYENEVLQSVFKGKESDFENSPLYDRFVTAGGMNVVPPPMTGNYMPSGPDIEIDYSQFTYGPKQTQPSESETQTSEFDTCESNISTETVNESNVACQPKVWSDAPIIEEYESDSKDEYVSIPTKEHETPSFANQQVKTPRETIKNHFTHSKNHKVDKKELGYRFTVRACFILVKRGDKANLEHMQRENNQKPFLFYSISAGYPHRSFAENKEFVIVDSGCSRHMTGNKAYLAEYQDFNGGPVAFGGSKGYITGKVLLRIPRQNNMYSFNLENIVPSGGLACLIAKATIDESNKWHRRLGHVNFKNLNKLVKGNLVRGLPSKIFQNDHTCVACQKEKQHKASCKAKSVSSISLPLQLPHIDLFGPTL
ncbi:putative ribonuclease H-like domain-containing protein [Tanacetum coccineum]|uniref:Ribonuclease H-like domain-containing protein n=1 Tax=Tanacetum coccineum TaxID=301880 RepID=A0ABQ5GIB1_9ASTR